MKSQPFERHHAFERDALAHTLVAALAHIRNVDPKITVEEVITLLMVAVRPGISASEIAVELGIARASQGRISSRLGVHGDRGLPGLSLILSSESKGNRRRKDLELSSDGQFVIDNTLNDILDYFDSRQIKEARAALPVPSTE